ncbi:MAG: SPOR domain-containing protein, partial [Acidobacteriota bacterium]|nr:SPOR domain-containing protein [Acidobacteriota bacterium]
FLQVVATSRPDAELIGETLAKKGFHTVVAPGPSAAIFRVLVGPLNGAADAAEVRVRLESAGFKNPYVRKY